MSNVDPMEATREQIEQAVVQWRVAREERLAIEKLAEQKKATETNLKTFILSAMQGQKYEGLIIDGRQTYVRTSQVPTASDRVVFESYILETGSLDLLQFRPAVGAIRERLEAGVEVPGIVMIDTYELGDKKA